MQRVPGVEADLQNVVSLRQLLDVVANNVVIRDVARRGFQQLAFTRASYL